MIRNSIGRFESVHFLHELIKVLPEGPKRDCSLRVLVLRRGVNRQAHSHSIANHFSSPVVSQQQIIDRILANFGWVFLTVSNAKYS
ncbi:hypothetical protein E1297_01860 [Roseibium sp. RKSG952]|nr:hypothetical protein [Roseibium sp. RKSG952]